MHIIKGYFNSVKEKTNKKQIFKQNFDHNVKNIFYFFFIFSYKCILHIETAFGKFCIVLSRLKRKKYALIYLIIFNDRYTFSDFLLSSFLLALHLAFCSSIAFRYLAFCSSTAFRYLAFCSSLALDIQLSVALQLFRYLAFCKS